MIVKKNAFYFACCVLIGFSAGNGHTAPIGSDRPIVQKNFQQLIKTNGCPGCDLAGAVLTRVDLSGADLSGANLAGAKCNLADFSGANLKGANLQGANLGGTDLAGADLTGANLTGAILQGAYLKGAKLDGMLTDQTSNQDSEATGETVFVPNGTKPKHTPYSQEVTIEKNRNFEEASPVVSKPQDKNGVNAQAKLPPVAPVTGSKHPVVMADAVVPQSVTDINEKPDVGTTVVLDEQKKLPVVTGKTVAATPEKVAVQPPQGTTVAGVDKDSAVHDMIARIEADSPDKNPPAIKKKDLADVAGPDTGKPKMLPEKSRPATTAAPVVEASPEIQTTTHKTTATGGQQNETVPAPTKTGGQPTETAASTAGEAAATVGALGAVVSQGVADVKNEAGSLLYTVETPAQAAAEKQAIVDRLLDTDACVECDLAGVDLSGKRLKGVDLERANLAGANLSDTNLSEANLKGADLSGANLRGADLSEADLYKADLTDADLTGADLSEASTDSADFTGAQGVPVTGENK